MGRLFELLSSLSHSLLSKIRSEPRTRLMTVNTQQNGTFRLLHSPLLKGRDGNSPCEAQELSRLELTSVSPQYDCSFY